MPRFRGYVDTLQPCSGFPCTQVCRRCFLCLAETDPFKSETFLVPLLGARLCFCWVLQMPTQNLFLQSVLSYLAWSQLAVLGSGNRIMTLQQFRAAVDP